MVPLWLLGSDGPDRDVILGDVMVYKLFLDDDADDQRRPEITVENTAWRRTMDLPVIRPDGHFCAESWAIARSYDEAVAIILELGFPTFVSFDHDIGPIRDGKAVANFLVDLDMDTNAMPSDFSWEIHSANRVGRENIESLLRGYIASKKRSSHL